MLNTSRACSQPNKLALTRKSSCSTNQSETKLAEDKTPYSLTTSVSTASVRPYSMSMELNTASKEGMVGRQEGLQRQVEAKEEGGKRTSDASFQKKIASTDTCAVCAGKEDTENWHVPPKRSKDLIHGMAPKYLCYNIWDPESDFTPNMADWTEVAEPLAGPPQCVLEDEVVTKTIESHSYLFKIVTPIQVEVFES